MKQIKSQITEISEIEDQKRYLLLDLRNQMTFELDLMTGNGIELKHYLYNEFGLTDFDVFEEEDEFKIYEI